MNNNRKNTSAELDTVPRARTVEGMRKEIAREQRITIPGIRAAFEKARRLSPAQLLAKLAGGEQSTSGLAVKPVTNTVKEDVEQ